MKKSLPCVLTVLLTFIQLSATSQVKLRLPLDGTAGQNYWIVNYVDHDTSTGLSDYSCGNKTYDGHEGTDFLIRSFKTMDTGVTVYAMSDGIVFKTKDSLFDRSKAKNSLGLGNYIAINHSNEYFAYYGHLKKYSLLVKVGDTVKEGQAIGQIGSSGNSTDPHLHLEIYNINSEIIDPFSGLCQSNTASAWNIQPVYDTSLKLIDFGLSDYVPHLDTLRERHSAYNKIISSTFDSVANFWAQLQGIQAGDTQRVEWYDTTGKLFNSFDYITPKDYWYYYFWAYIPTPKDHTFGKYYNVKYYINGIKYADENFSVYRSLNINPQNKKKENIILYPNPAGNTLHIKVNGECKEPYRLYNIQGVLINTYPAGTRQLALAHLPRGTYLLRHANAYAYFAKQ